MKNEYLFPCEKCGAKLKFSATKGELICEYCSHVNVVDKSFENIVEKDYNRAISRLKESEKKHAEVTSIKCKSCAATFEISSNVHSSSCPYCATPIVNSVELYRPLKPQALLPFSIDKKEAREHFKNWLKKLWFAPSKLKNYGTSKSKLEAIYTPYWTYDSDTFTAYTGQRGDKYYVNESYSVVVDGKSQQKTRRVEKIRWSHASGSVSRAFDDVLVMATSSQKHTLQNWDLENLVDYNESYLSGFESEVYSIELDAGLVNAKEQMRDVISQDVKRDIGGDVQKITSLDSTYSNVTFKHILLPIYASAFKFNNKVYSYVINGRNGEIIGERPYSVIKIAFAIFGVAIVAAGAYYFNYM